MAKSVTTQSPLAIIDAKIASIKTRGIQLRRDCHETLVMIMDHYAAHGDYTRLKLLTDAIKGALGASMSQAANQWVSEFVPSLKWDKEIGGFAHLKGVKVEIINVVNRPMPAKGDAPATTFTGNARDLPFYELERPVNQTPFDLNMAIVQLIGRAKRESDKAIEAGKEPSFPAEQLEMLEKAVIKPKTEGEVTPIKVTAGAKPSKKNQEEVPAVKAA